LPNEEQLVDADSILSKAGQDGLLYRFYTADVFTHQRFGGNPLAVFPQAEGLTTQQMQTLAREFNLSETVFVLPPQNPQHTCQVRIFTPAAELPFAGHPTVGTAFLLTAIAQVPLIGNPTTLILEEGVGAVNVQVFSDAGTPTSAHLSAAQLPQEGPPPPTNADLAAVLSLDPDDILDRDYAPQTLSCGMPFLFVPLRDRSALARIRFNLAAWETTLANFWAPHVYAMVLDLENPGVQVRSRMFAPALGISEDPATGSAATALGGYLGQRESLITGTKRWTVEQGVEMGRPSQLDVEIDKDDGRITSVRVGGGTVIVSSGEIFVNLS
jgi:trans-2,3-dihydro-3-hydroxyanthranilate isomerase